MWGILTILLTSLSWAEPTLAIPSARTAPNDMVAVDLADLAAYRPETREIVNPILEALRNQPDAFLGQWGKRSLTLVSAVATAGPLLYPGSGFWMVPLMASVKTRSDRYALVSLRLAVDAEGSVHLVDRGDLRPFSKLAFDVRTSLIERKTIVEEASVGWKIVYPVAVGGFNQGITKGSKGRTVLVTPRFTHATLPKSEASERRGGYFKNLPFIRIHDRTDDYDGYAFHIYVDYDHPYAPANDTDFRRGFHSHGCIRMRQGDLEELWAVVRKSAPKRTPFEVTLRSDVRDREDSPLPLDDASYWNVVNCGSAAHPRSCKDPGGGGLTWMEQIFAAPPIADLEEQLYQPRSLDPQGDDEDRWVPSEPETNTP